MAQTKEGSIKLSANYHGLSVDEYLEKIKTEAYCNKCKKWKEKKGFGIDNSRATGLHKNCIDCRRVNGGKKGNFIKGRTSPMKGKTFKGAALKNIKSSVTNANKKRAGEIKKYSQKGYEKLLLAIRKPRPSTTGEKKPAWRGGKHNGRQKDLGSHQYRQWRREVFERDKYTCQDCGDKKGGNLEAHHIKTYMEYPEFRYIVPNGITLCKDCHQKRHFNPNSKRNLKKIKNGKRQ